MVRAIAIILALIVIVGAVATVIIVGAKTVGLMTRQNYGFGDALHLAWEETIQWVNGLFGKANAEDVLYYPMTNRFVEVKGCTSL